MSELKIVSYNIWKGALEKNIVNNVFNFAKQGVNVFCLQEVHRPKKGREFIGDIILKKLGSQWQAEFFLSHTGGPADNGLGIFWKANELKSLGFHTLSVSKINGLALFEQVIEAVQGNRTEPVQRGILIGDFVLRGKKIRICNVHLDWQGSAKHRTEQFRQLMEYLQTQPEVDAEIICGDFNSLGFFGLGQRLKKFRSLMGPEFVSCFPNYVRTTMHQQQLDHIFVRNLKIIQAEVLKARGSDHYPLMSQLSFL